ncbi:MAG: acyl-CoA dehydrogenase family protein, partial [Bacteroidetes bacterium]
MEFSLNENQLMITDMIRDFAAKEIVPYQKQWDESQEFPVPLFKKLGALGLMGVLVPEIYQG